MKWNRVVTPNCVRAQSRVFTRRRLRSPSDPKHPAATPGLVRRTTHRPQARPRRARWDATTSAKPSGQAQQHHGARLRGPRVQARPNGSPPADPSTDTGRTRPALKIERCRSRNCSRQLQRSHPAGPSREEPGVAAPRPRGNALTRRTMAGIWGHIPGTRAFSLPADAQSNTPKRCKRSVGGFGAGQASRGSWSPRAWAWRSSAR